MAANPSPNLPPTRICVFCSTTLGHSPAHLAAARSLAQTMHERSIHLVYGGGTVGLMGELAKTLVRLSGPDSAQGIIPQALLGVERSEGGGDEGDVAARGKEGKRGWLARLPLLGSWRKSGDGKSTDENSKATSALLSEDIYGRTIIVSDLQSRKRRMIREVVEGGPGSGFVALSGGFGTLDELMEVVTAWQMGLHTRGICVFNVEGFWDRLLGWVEHAVEAGFVREGGKGVFVEKGTAEECVEWLREYQGSNGGLG